VRERNLQTWSLHTAFADTSSHTVAFRAPDSAVFESAAVTVGVKHANRNGNLNKLSQHKINENNSIFLQVY
jgi:hypothetical protein